MGCRYTWASVSTCVRGFPVELQRGPSEITVGPLDLQRDGGGIVFDLVLVAHRTDSRIDRTKACATGTDPPSAVERVGVLQRISRPLRRRLHNVQLFFDCAAVVSDLSENVTRQGDFLLAGIAGGRKCAMVAKAVGGRASGKWAFCEPIMMLMLVLIGMVILRSSRILRPAVLRSTRTH